MAKLNDDFHDLLSALSAEKARFLVVGAYAVAVHGRPRTTKDIDVWVEASPDNAARVMRALRAFGAPLGDLREEELHVEGTGFQMGVPPRRIDVLTKISGIAFADAFPNRVETSFGDGLVCAVIGVDDLIANKRAAARPQDLADVDALLKIRDREGRPG